MCRRSCGRLEVVIAVHTIARPKCYYVSGSGFLYQDMVMLLTASDLEIDPQLTLLRQLLLCFQKDS